MSVNAVDQTTGNTTPLAGNTNNLVGNLSALTTNTKSDAVGAINEVNQTKQNATDNNLQTTDKTIVGGINELRSGLTNAVTGTAAMQSDHTINEAVLSRCGMLYMGYFNITLTSAVSAWSNFAHIEANLKYTTLCYAVSGGSNKVVYCTTGGNVQTTQALESGTTLHIVLCAVANFS